MRFAAALTWLLHRIAFPLLAIGAAMLHIFTAYIAFYLAPTKLLGAMAAVAVWITPGISQLVVAYHAWRASGSMVNSYSFWLLAWIALLAATLILKRIGVIAQHSSARKRTSPKTPVHLG